MAADEILDDAAIAEHEAAIADVTGTHRDGLAVDHFDGTDHQNVHDRRVIRADYRDSDFLPQTDFFDNYNGPTRGSEVNFNSPESVNSWISLQDALGEEKYGSRWNELIDKHIGPWIQDMQRRDPVWLQQFLSRDDAYDLAFKAAREYEKQLRSRVPTKAELNAMTSGDELQAWLDEHRNGALSVEDEEEPEGMTQRQRRAMNSISSPAEFVRQLDAYKRRNGW